MYRSVWVGVGCGVGWDGVGVGGRKIALISDLGNIRQLK